MKQISFLVLSLFLVAGPLMGQDSPKKMMKKADRAYSKYNLDQRNNKDELMKARDLILSALEDQEIADEGRAWVVKGQVFSSLANEDLKMLMANPEAEPSYPDAPFTSYEAFFEALNVAEKSRYEREALEGLGNLTPIFSTVGNSYLQQQAYDKAYEPLSALLHIHETFVAEGEDPIYQSEEDYNQQRFVVAICAIQAGDRPTAKSLLMELYEEEYPDAAVYSSLFDLLMNEDNEEKALEVLDKGKELFPDDNTILFARINYYIQNDELELLEESLMEAVEAEPENASVHSALANVYMKIYNQMIEEGESGNMVVDNHTVISKKGSGLKNTRPFKVSDKWEVSWDAKGDIFQIYLKSQNGTMTEVIANQEGPGSGSSYIEEGGQYRLKINATGDWEVNVKQLGENDEMADSVPESLRYRNLAIEYYDKAIDLDPDDFEPYYSVGSIYFNEAAVITQKMSELGMSKEDQQMYDSLKVESEKKFEKALPYFKKAESLEPNDRNTLIALREIFARMNEYEKAQELKVRMERISSGETLEEPYFNE